MTILAYCQMGDIEHRVAETSFSRPVQSSTTHQARSHTVAEQFSNSRVRNAPCLNAELVRCFRVSVGKDGLSDSERRDARTEQRVSGG
jgi:hypothetical protein